MRRLGTALVLALVGCAPLEDDRQAFLVDQLVLDNQRWLTRDPALLDAKFRRMAADPYDFMRATATVGVVDWTRPGSDRLPTAFITVAGTETTLLAGDPHPENIGVHAPLDGPLLLEVNDFDGSTYGPYLWDVRRAMTGLGVLLTEVGCVGDCLETGLSRFATGYAEGIQSEGAGFHSGYGPFTEAPPVVRNLLDKATEDALARRTLADETYVTVAGERRFLVDEVLADDVGDRRPEGEHALQAERLATWLADTRDVRVLDTVQRFGRGVASLPAVRYAFLVDDGEPGDADDRLVQLREVLDPLPLPGWRDALDGGFETNAERVVTTSRALWSRPDADPALGAREDGVLSFKTTTLSGAFEGFEHARIQRRVEDGTFDVDDLHTWATWLGTHLASVHDRAPTRDGGDAGASIRADLQARTSLFVEERVEDALLEIDATYRDHGLFRGALDRLGPDLGATGVLP